MWNSLFSIPHRVVTALLAAQKLHLSFGFREIDDIFPGLETGSFSVLFGHPVCNLVSFVLCVRSQLPVKKGGLSSSVLFNDGGNCFDPYAISSIARDYKLDPTSVLSRIYISRAFTAYQLASLILQKSERALRKYRSKILIISDIAGLFLDKDVPRTESIGIFSKVCRHLGELAKKRNALVLATYFPRKRSRRSVFLEAMLFGAADTVIGFKLSRGNFKFALEKHPSFKSFEIELFNNAVTIDKFMEE